MKYTQKLPDDSVNISKNNILIDTIKFLVSIFLIILVSYGFLLALSNIIINNLTFEQEKKLLTFVDFDFSIAKENKKLTKILNDLKSCSNIKNDFTVKVMKDEEENAFALPGGTIVVTSKLLENIKSDNELYFVLGHEIGHYVNKDHLKNLGNSIILMALSFLLPSDIDYISNMSFHITSSSNSKEHELKADEVGLELMYCSIKNVDFATNFFERLKNKHSKFEYMLATHPHPKSRIKNIKQLITNNQYIK
jgi:Zn-dependent protease with chaperone function